MGAYTFYLGCIVVPAGQNHIMCIHNKTIDQFEFLQVIENKVMQMRVYDTPQKNVIFIAILCHEICCRFQGLM